MTDSAQTMPVPEAVGELYDQLTLTAMSSGTFNPHVHIGYWDAADSDYSLNEAVLRMTDVVIDQLGVDDSAHVLDLGCGVGGPALRMVERSGGRVTGVSISREQVEAANRLAAEAGVTGRATFLHADAMSLPFPDESFDAVLVLEAIGHMPSRERALAEACRVLRPGGRIVLTDGFERGPRKEGRHPAIDKFCRNFMVTMADIDDYVAMFHRSGLRPRSLLDITEQSTQRTCRELSASTSGEGRPAGIDPDHLPGRWHPSEMLGVTEFGYLLAVAERP